MTKERGRRGREVGGGGGRVYFSVHVCAKPYGTLFLKKKNKFTHMYANSCGITYLEEAWKQVKSDN